PSKRLAVTVTSQLYKIFWHSLVVTHTGITGAGAAGSTGAQRVEILNASRTVDSSTRTADPVSETFQVLLLFLVRLRTARFGTPCSRLPIESSKPGVSAVARSYLRKSAGPATPSLQNCVVDSEAILSTTCSIYTFIHDVFSARSVTSYVLMKTFSVFIADSLQGSNKPATLRGNGKWISYCAPSSLHYYYYYYYYYYGTVHNFKATYCCERCSTNRNGFRNFLKSLNLALKS
ncbi:hypothetical protein L9F63_015943, partial [Diploptera punctata]